MMRGVCGLGVCVCVCVGGGDDEGCVRLVKDERMVRGDGEG